MRRKANDRQIDITVKAALIFRFCASVMRGGSVRLNRFMAFLKWISALIMLPPEPATAG